MKFLLTGGAGFIGSNLADKLLELGNEVICIDNFDNFYSRDIKENNISQARSDPKYKFIEGDVTDKKLVSKLFSENKFDLVIHMAAKAGVRPSITDPVGCYEVNVNGTLNILEEMRKNGMKKMFFASSSSIYGNNVNVPFKETDNVDNPISPYAASKRAGELLCHTYHHLHDFDIFCFRFFTVFGPRQRPDLAIHKFVNLINSDKAIQMFGDGSTSRDYTYVDDIVSGIINAIPCLKGYEIINLGESKTISLAEMIGMLQAKMNKKARIEKLPFQAGDVDRTYADISKARKLINYDPKWSFGDGLTEFLKWKRS